MKDVTIVMSDGIDGMQLWGVFESKEKALKSFTREVEEISSQDENYDELISESEFDSEQGWNIVIAQRAYDLSGECRDEPEILGYMITERI